MSVATGGTQGNVDSFVGSISDDGDVITFSSSASNLVAGDTNAKRDVFARVRSTGVTTRVSVSSAGVQSDGDSSWNLGCGMSADGRWIAFDSSGTNLVAGDTNAASDIFLHDRTTAATTRVSLTSAGFQANGASTFNDLSANGRWLVFQSHATNLVAGDTNALSDAFVRDLQTGTTKRVSVSSAGVQANVGTGGDDVSEDGRWVVFSSQATNLVSPATIGIHAFLHDTWTATTTLVSVDSAGVRANDSSYDGTISGDGRYIAFQSYATNLVPGDTNGTWDVFLRDRVLGTTTRISVSNGGTQWGSTFGPKFSTCGRYVALMSWSSFGVVGDSNNAVDCFVRDLHTGNYSGVSVVNGNVWAGNNTSVYPVISSNGRYVTFESLATNLVTGDTNNRRDVFVRDWPNCIAPQGADCNGNGQHDVCDIASGVSSDLNQNGLPDDCEAPACALERLESPAPAIADFMGFSRPAIDGTRVLVGSYGGGAYGTATVYRRDGIDLVVEQVLAPSGVSGWFGQSVALQGEWAVVGASQDSERGSTAGALFLFRRNPSSGVWSQTAKFFGSDTAAGDALGHACVWSGNQLFVSALHSDSPVAVNAGKVYVFQWNGSSFTEVAQVHASDGATGDLFGNDLDVDDGHLAVGAPNAHLPGINDAGAVYVWRDSGAGWLLENKLTSNGAANSDSFGFSLSLRGDWLAIGEPQDDTNGGNAGTVFVYSHSDATHTWSVVSEVRPANVYGQFGNAVELADDALFVGAPYHQTVPGFYSGMAFVFRRKPGPYPFATEDDTRLSVNASDYHYFGHSLAYDGGLLVVGAPYAQINGQDFAGAAYAYGVIGEDCNGNVVCDYCDIQTGAIDGNVNGVLDACDIEQFCFCAAPAGPCGNHDAGGGCATSTGSGAVMSYSGTLSVTSDDLVLTTSAMPLNKLAIMFMSTSTTANPFAYYDGRRCLVAPIYRWATTNSGALGSIAYGPGLAAGSVARFPVSGWIQTGRTFAFQTWFRDPTGPCGSGGNLSNGVKATFTP